LQTIKATRGEELLLARHKSGTQHSTPPDRTPRLGHCATSIMDGNPIKPYSRAQVKKYKEPAEIQESSTELVPRPLDLQRSQTTHITEINLPGDDRMHDPRMKAAKKKKIDGLVARGTSRVVLRDQIPRDANKLGGRFVLSIKDAQTEREVWKARYVI
jgi:hypothetical protein